jgi:inorganic pyrophosphatase
MHESSSTLARTACALLLAACAGVGCWVDASPRAGRSGRSGRSGAEATTLIGSEHFLLGHPAQNADGTLNVVVEIPAGTTAKWEVDKGSGALLWETREGAPRVVQYLGYPGNYGMVPRTLLAEADGGDGDPLDVLVLGDPLERGSIVRARAVAVLELDDDGERDDKLVCVRDGTPFEGVRDLVDLERDFAGVTTIVATWFASYKGPGRLTVRGWGDARRAAEIVERAVRDFEPAAHDPATR